MPSHWIRKDYLLNEAFELVGERLFGTDWRGYGAELKARKIESPADLKSARKPIETEIAACDEKLTNLKNEAAKTINEQRAVEIATERESLISERAKLRGHLVEKLSPSESYVRDYEAYQRRSKAEKILVSALSSGKIEAYCLHTMDVPDFFWRQERGFRYDIKLSIIWMPRTYSSERRESVRIRDKKFDVWLDTIAPIDPSKHPDLTPEDHARYWFSDITRSGPKEKSRNEYVQDMIDRYPGLSRKAAKRIWENEALPDWKKSGAPKKN